MFRSIQILIASFMLLAAPAALAQDATAPSSAPITHTDPTTKPVVIAQQPQSGGIVQLAAFGWLEPYVDSIVQALIIAGFGWLGKTKYGQMLDESGRASLETFIKNRASSLIADGAVKMESKSVDVHSEMLAKVASEASIAIPAAMKRFNLTPENIEARIVAAIPQVPAGAQMVAQAHKDDPDNPPVPVTDRPPTVGS